MKKENNNRKLGNTTAALGGLFTILGLTIFQDQKTLQLISLVTGVVLALFGVTLIKKGKK